MDYFLIARQTYCTPSIWTRMRHDNEKRNPFHIYAAADELARLRKNNSNPSENCMINNIFITFIKQYKIPRALARNQNCE